MRTFARSIEIEAPRTWLFEVMQDYARRLAWDEFLSKAHLVGGATESALGVRALCVDTAGREMETEYVSFKPPERVAVKMTRGPWMFGAFAGSWVYEELGDCCTRVTFRYSMELRPRVLGSVGDVALSKIFSLDMKRRLASAKERLEQLYQSDVRSGGATAQR
jgi:ribosome-associated toxin RatA of RatAB toxin-antitoxin module